MEITIDQFQIGGHRNFIYLITFGDQSLVVDPQSDLRPWQSRMRELGAQLAGIVLTHTHWDHVAGVPPLVEQDQNKERSGKPKLPIYLHNLDAQRLRDSSKAVQERFVFVGDGDKIPLGSRSLEVLHTPGHSAGECSYYLHSEAAKPPRLFTGDTIFVGDVGRCDLESGSVDEMFATLERLKRLPPDTIIYPGHHYGQTPTTTIAHECTHSPAWMCKTVKELDALP